MEDIILMRLSTPCSYNEQITEYVLFLAVLLSVPSKTIVDEIDAF